MKKTNTIPIPGHLPVPVLLSGFSRLVHFLLEEEVDFLCGAKPCEHSLSRVNFRRGHHAITLPTALGGLPIHVPDITYFHLRPSLTKRAKRLNREIFQSLARVYDEGVTPEGASTLIKTLWTVELPDALLNELAGKLLPILESWRCMPPRDESPPASFRARHALAGKPTAPAFTFSVY